MYRKIQVALLSGFYPAIFFLSNNWHVFSFQQSLILLIGTSLVSLTILFSMSYSLNYIAQFLYKKIDYTNDNDTSNAQRIFTNPMLTICSMILCIYLLRNTLESIDIQKTILYFIIVATVIFITWHTHKRGLKLLLNCLVILTSLSIVNLLINVHMKTKIPIESWAIQNKAIYDQIKFRKKPNVYLIIAESLPDKSALKAVYNIDNAAFYEKMGELGLKINHNHFSNYNHSLASLPSLFGMEHHFGLINIGNFDSLGGRRMLEAKTYNPVIDTFRANNYKIQYLHNVSGLIPNGAAVDFCIPAPALLYGLEIFLTHQNMVEPTIFSPKKSEPLISIKNQIAITSLKDESYFNFIYLDFPGHSPSRLRARSKKIINQKLGEFRIAYSKKIELANQQLIDLIKFIKNKDQDSIIIMIGDHGSWGFRIKEDTQGKPISNQLYFLDRFGVFAGIRAPHILSDLMENGTIKSHVNLFKYVFAYLSEDEKILETKAPDDSYDGALIMAIKDGKILENSVKVNLHY